LGSFDDGALLRGFSNDIWISHAIEIFEAFNLPQTHMVDFGLDNLTFLHSSFLLQ